MWKYSRTLMDHFMNPRNSGQLPDPDGHSEVGSPQCGDAMTLDIKVDEQDRIIDIRFMTFGCAGAIAASSALTELARGKTLREALDISNEQIVQFLGGMPEEKYHCSVMGHEALAEAVADFMRRRERIDRHLKELIEHPPERLGTALSGGKPRVLHVHPSRVEIALPRKADGSAAGILREELSGLAGREVEVEVTG